MIAPTTSIALRPHRVTLTDQGAAVPDGDGGWTQTELAYVPAQAWARITPASAAELERVSSGATVQSTATHIVTMPYHQQVTTKTRVLFGDRTFHVTGVSNVDERKVEMTLVCTEVVT